jgi:uncharacterized protein YhjY with autotransporter beta-barrel domain
MQMFEKEMMVIALKREVVYAESQLRETSTGHVYTAISWMKGRIESLEKQLDQEYRSEHL